MIEATEIGRSQKPEGAIGPSLLRDRLDDLVGDRIAAPDERRRQGAAIGGLIAAGLVGVVGSMLSAILGAGVAAAVAPLALAGLCLAAAAYLSLTGAFGHVVWLVWTACVAGLGFLVVALPGLSPAVLLAFAAGPLESLRLRRFTLTAWLGASSGAALASLWLLSPALPPLDAADGLAMAVLSIYLASFVFRHRVAVVPVIIEASKVPAREPSNLDAAADRFDVAMFRLTSGGSVAAVSATALAMLRGEGVETVSQARLDGSAMIDLVHVADRVAFLHGLDRARGGTKVDMGLRLRQSCGRYLDVRLDLSPVGSGGSADILARLDGATPAVAADGVSALEQALDAANQSSAAKSQFLAAVSHELRTPLNAIIGFSDILHQEFFGGFETERQKEYVGLIRQSGQHLLSVVNGLLDVSKIEAGRYELRPEPVAVGEAMALAAGVIRDEALAKTLRLDIRHGCRDLGIVADRQACHQILLNLLSNAVKFTDAGVVTLESRLVDGAIEISVCDTGIGIPEADVKRLGEPFVQVSAGHSRRYQGTGLGLSLVKGLAELHGGAMTIHSQPKIGTKVTVRLPLDCTQPGNPSMILKENVVALNDARTKTHPLPQTSPSCPTHPRRRTA